MVIYYYISNNNILFKGSVCFPILSYKIAILVATLKLSILPAYALLAAFYTYKLLHILAKARK